MTTKMTTQSIQVAWINPSAYTDGPGHRASIAVQGCSIRCPGCQVPQTWKANAGMRMSVQAAAEQVLAPGLPVTVLGGEPFDQAPAVAALVRLVKAAGRHLMIYTGYVLEDLALRARREPAVQQILAMADILVDGPFEADRDHDRLQYRGSENQRPIDLEYWREHGAIQILDWDTTVDLTILPDGAILVPKGYDLEQLLGGVVSPARRCGDVPDAEKEML